MGTPVKFAALFNYDNGDAMIGALVYLEATERKAALLEAVRVVENYDQGLRAAGRCGDASASRESWELGDALVRRRQANVEAKRAANEAAAKELRRAEYEKLRAEFEGT